jgi:hypothetical protein
MSDLKLRIRIVNLGGNDFAMVIQDSSLDPHAHQAWSQVKSDLENHLQLKHKESAGVLAFGEFSDSYNSGDGEVTLQHDADPGDLAITASDEETLRDVITRLSELPNYEMQPTN